MFRKLSNKFLLILFAILAIVVAIVFIHDSKKGERTFKSELFTIDSSAVTSITIYPKGKANEIIKLGKEGKEWDVISNNKHYPADSSFVKNILHVLAHIAPERVAGTDNASWKEYDMTDEASTRVVVEQGQNVAADFRVGKISFSQGQRSQNRRGNQNMEVKSHIRVAGDDRVYVVDGFLSMMFGPNLGQYRNRMICRFQKDQVIKMTFVYPGDSSFILSKKDNKWLINDQPADSAETAKYLNSVENTVGSEFADENGLFPNYQYTLKIEGNNMSPIEINGAMDPAAKKYYLKSNVNPSSGFSSSTPNLFNQVFAGKSTLSEKKHTKAGKKK